MKSTTALWPVNRDNLIREHFPMSVRDQTNVTEIEDGHYWAQNTNRNIAQNQSNSKIKTPLI